MLAEQGQHFGIVLTLQHLPDGVQAFFFHFALLEHHLAVDERVDGHGYQTDNGYGAAEVDDHCHEEADSECRTGCDEPAADDAQHARDAVDSRVTSPGAVGQGGTHGYHERHVGRGQRQLQRSAQCNEQGGQYQIDRSTHEVESCPVFQCQFFLAEAGVQPALGAFGRNLADAIGQVHAVAHQTTGDGGGAEAFFTLVLTGQGYFCLDDVVCFLGSPQGIDHYAAGGHKEVPGCLGRSEQRTHQPAVCAGGLTVGHIVRIGIISGQGDTDEVHQVITGESQGQGESTHHHYNLEHIHPAPVQDLHQDGEEYEEAAHDE